MHRKMLPKWWILVFVPFKHLLLCCDDKFEENVQLTTCTFHTFYLPSDQDLSFQSCVRQVRPFSRTEHLEDERTSPAFPGLLGSQSEHQTTEICKGKRSFRKVIIHRCKSRLFSTHRQLASSHPIIIFESTRCELASWHLR